MAWWDSDLFRHRLFDHGHLVCVVAHGDFRTGYVFDISRV